MRKHPIRETVIYTAAAIALVVTLFGANAYGSGKVQDFLDSHDLPTATSPATITSTNPTTTTTTTTTVPSRASTPDSFVAGLVVSMGEPDQATIDRYADWNATAIALWEPEEAQYWTDYPAYVWVTHDGRQVNDPTDLENPDAWQPLELPHNVFAVQVGDEPIPQEAVDTYPLYRPMPGRLNLEITEFTNWSYWTPLVIGETDMEPTLDVMFESYVGDVVVNGEYQMEEGRYIVLDYFRRQGLARNQPYWQYLNAYTGQETGYETIHSASDLAWSAFTGAAFGYTGHIWFTYALGAGHGEFDGNDNGSIIHTPSGTFNETRYWNTTAAINKPLIELAAAIAPLTSTDVCWTDCQFASSEPLVVGTFTDPVTGTTSWIVVNGNHTFTGSDEPATVTMPFDVEMTYPNRQTLHKGDTVTLRAGWPTMLTEATL